MRLFRRFLSSTAARVAGALFAAYLAYQGWMAFEAPRRIEGGLLDAAEKNGRIPVLVRLPFAPERFHILKVQDLGRVRGVIGNTIEVGSIDARGIWTLARTYYWIQYIDADKRAR
jgi:hypothetical protein